MSGSRGIMMLAGVVSISREQGLPCSHRRKCGHPRHLSIISASVRLYMLPKHGGYCWVFIYTIPRGKKKCGRFARRSRSAQGWASGGAGRPGGSWRNRGRCRRFSGWSFSSPHGGTGNNIYNLWTCPHWGLGVKCLYTPMGLG